MYRSLCACAGDCTDAEHTVGLRTRHMLAEHQAVITTALVARRRIPLGHVFVVGVGRLVMTR
jgi:hypothetical protein